MTRKFSFFKDNNEKDHTHATSKHDPHTQQILAEPPLSPALRRLSSRKGDAASLSTYSSSPTSPSKRKASPIIREVSPPHVSKSGEPVPTQSSYGTLSLLPAHPAISPLTESSFMFGLDSRSQPHSRSSSDQKPVPTVIRRDFERANYTSHPLANEVYQNSEGDVSVSRSTLTNVHDGAGSNVKSSPRVDETTHGVEINTNTSHPVLDSAEIKDQRGVGESHEPPAASNTNVEWDVNSAHALLVAAQNSLKHSQRPSSPAISELEAPLPSSHPLLFETRHSQLPSRTAPSTPPRHPAGDLPLRHYYSQEQFHSSGFNSLRQQETETMPKRSNSLLQRGSTQFLPEAVQASITSQSQPTISPPGPPQPSNTPSPLRLVTDMTNINAEPDNSNIDLKPLTEPELPQSHFSDATGGTIPNPTVLAHPSNPIENGVIAVPTGSATAPADVASIPSSIAMPTDTAAVSTDVINNPKNNKPSPTSLPHRTSPSSQEAELTPTTKYKTSATSNIPFYLNPVSSTALVDFLASDPPISSTHPGKQIYPNTPDNNITAEDTSSPQPNAPPLQVPTDFGPPLHSSHNETPTIPPESRPETPHPAPPPPAAEKRPRWKKVFGSRGAARQRSPKTQEVVIVGKGEWYKIERKKKKSHGQSKGSTDLNDTNGAHPAAENPPTATVEAGIVGVGKDGVWISRKNFVKT